MFCPTSTDVVDRLFDFTARGGGLWVILGENVTAEQFNSLVFRDGSGLVPVALGTRVKAGDDHDSFFTIHPPEGPHPATVLLGDTERLDIDDVRISQHWQFSIPEATDDVAVLLETGDGCTLPWSILPVKGGSSFKDFPTAPRGATFRCARSSSRSSMNGFGISRSRRRLATISIPGEPIVVYRPPRNGQ